MGVRLVVLLAEPDVNAKVLRTFNGGGSCCSVFANRTHEGRAMLVGFTGNKTSNSDPAALVNSKMAQALVPGAAYVKHFGDGYDTALQHQYFISYENLPGDQVATLLRLLKVWSCGNYERTFQEVQKAFPKLSKEDAAVVAVYCNTGFWDDDGTTTFHCPSYKTAAKNGAYMKDDGSNWMDFVGEFRMGGLLELLKGNINQGVQPEFRKSGYFKARQQPAIYQKNDSLAITVAHPVCIKSDKGPLLTEYESKGNYIQSSSTSISRIKALKEWLEAEGIALEEVSSQVGKPTEQTQSEAQGNLLEGIGAQSVEQSKERPKPARDSSGRFVRKDSGVTSGTQASSTGSSSQPSLVKPGRIPSRYSESDKERLRANRRLYVKGIHSLTEYQAIIQQVRSKYE